MRATVTVSQLQTVARPVNSRIRVNESKRGRQKPLRENA